jgi:glucose/arabinose dehydrogenase
VNRHPGASLGADWQILLGVGLLAIVMASSCVFQSPPTPAQPETPTSMPTPTSTPSPERLLALAEASRPRAILYAEGQFPVDLAFASDGRLFFTELGGTIRVAQNGTTRLFYDLNANGFPVEVGSESGLLGITLLEDASRLWVYVRYVHAEAPRRQRVLRLSEDGNAEVIVDDLPVSPAPAVHNGGGLRFGPDGYLYMTVGVAKYDRPGGIANQGGDEESLLAQDPTSPHGTILRMRPDGSNMDIYAYGFRNPFALTFAPDGTLYVADVGPASPEVDEINRIVRGGNYGWPLHTGRRGDDRFIDPIWSFEHIVTPAGLAFAGDELYVCEFSFRRLRRFGVTKEGLVDQGVVAEGCIANVVRGLDGAIYFTSLEGIRRLEVASPTSADVFCINAGGAKPLPLGGYKNLWAWNPKLPLELPHAVPELVTPEFSTEWGFETPYSTKVTVTQESHGMQGVTAHKNDTILVHPGFEYFVTVVAMAPTCGHLQIGIREFDAEFSRVIRYSVGEVRAIWGEPTRLTYTFMPADGTAYFGIDLRAPGRAGGLWWHEGFVWYYADLKVVPLR